MFDFIKKSRDRKLVKQQEVEQLREQQKFVLRYSGTLPFSRVDSLTREAIDNTSLSLRILFFENSLEKRKYEIKGDKDVIEHFKKGKCYGDCEEWMAGGIIPEWAECVVAKKLGS